MPRRKCCIDRISSSHEPNCSSPIVISSPNPLFNDPFSQLHRMRYQFYPPIIFTLLHIPMLFINHTFIMLEFSLVKYLIKKLSQHIHTFFIPTFQHVNWNVIWSCRIIILFHFQWFFYFADFQCYWLIWHFIYNNHPRVFLFKYLFKIFFSLLFALIRKHFFSCFIWNVC